MPKISTPLRAGGILFFLVLMVPASLAFAFSGAVSINNVPTVPAEDDGTWDVIFNPVTALNYTDPAGSANYRTIVTTPAGGPWTKIRITFAAESDEMTDDLSASVCVRSGSTDDCTASPTQILWSASSDTEIGTNSTIRSDSISFSFDSSQTLLVNTHTVDGEGRYLWVGDGSAYYSAGPDDTMTQNVSYADDAHQFNIELVEGWNPD